MGRQVLSPDGKTLAVWNEQKQAWDYQGAEFGRSGGLAGSLPIRAPITGSEDIARTKGADSLTENLAIRGGYLASRMGSEVAEQGGRALSGLLGSIAGGETIDQAKAGLDAFVGRRETSQADARLRMDALSEDYPLTGIAAEIIANTALPARGGAGVISGITEGMSQGETPMEKGVFSAMNVIANIAGGSGAFKAIDRARRRFTDPIEKSRRAASERLIDQGLPMTRGQRTAAPREIARDRVISTATGETPLKREASLFLNQKASDAFGGQSGVLDKPTLNQARERIGSVFESFKDVEAIDTNILQSSLDEVVGELEAIGDLDLPKAKAAVKAIEDLKTIPSGTNYMQTRQRLWKIADGMWKTPGQEEAGKLVQKLIEGSDDALEAVVDVGRAEALRNARQEWRMLKAIRRGKSVSPGGELNPASASAALNSIYPGYDVGIYPRDASGNLTRQGDFMQSVDDYRQAIEQFRDSGTATRLIPYLPGQNSVRKATGVAGRLIDQGYGEIAEQAGAAATRVGAQGLLAPEPPSQ